MKRVLIKMESNLSFDLTSFPVPTRGTVYSVSIVHRLGPKLRTHSCHIDGRMSQTQELVCVGPSPSDCGRGKVPPCEEGSGNWTGRRPEVSGIAVWYSKSEGREKFRT